MKISLLRHSVLQESAQLMIPKVMMEDGDTEQWLFREGMKILFTLQNVHESIGRIFPEDSAIAYFQNIKGNFCMGLQHENSILDWIEFQAHIEDRSEYLDNLDWVEALLGVKEIVKTPPRRPALVIV